MSDNPQEPIQLAQRLDFESKLFSEGDDSAAVEARREAHLADVKAKAGAEVEHAKEVAAAHKKALGGEKDEVVDLAKVPAE
ncbi:hypothetical protein P7C70_g5121, partial [Phenoliferia sp. Uapishka_3]